MANGIYTSDYVPRNPEPYLLWPGRICPEKGVHLALEVAHRLNALFIMAGPVHPYPGYLGYFKHHFQPLLDDRRIYIGPFDFAQKSHLLAHAQALLIPRLAAETSSLVAVEVLTFGTAVIAFRASV